MATCMAAQDKSSTTSAGRLLAASASLPLADAVLGQLLNDEGAALSC
jgi:hypothetical protein